MTAVVIGAGSRGTHAYAPYALRYPHELSIVGVAEPIESRRARLVELHAIDPQKSLPSWEELLSLPRMADAAFICTQDRMHLEPALAAMKKGYHILLEKPMASTPEECIRLEGAARSSGLVLSVAHVLRYTPFFSRLYDLLEGGAIGKLVSMQHNENVGFRHYSHSYVRGNWRRSEETSPMILAKSCHDLDLLRWFARSPARWISSYGRLSHFLGENKPPGAPDRCLSGCEYRSSCAWYAPNLYLTGETGWPVDTITEDTSPEGILTALKDGPYGRCVYACDNNVVDHQVVNLEFENGVTAVFTMGAFNYEGSRTIKLMGTEGEIHGHMEKGEIRLFTFSSREEKLIRLPPHGSGHGGGDEAIVRNFVQTVREGDVGANRTDAAGSVEGHLLAFAAETSRLEEKMVDMRRYLREYTKEEQDDTDE